MSTETTIVPAPRSTRWHLPVIGLALLAFIGIAFLALRPHGPEVQIALTNMNAEGNTNDPGENYGFKLNFDSEEAQLIVGQDFPAEQIDGRLIRTIGTETYQQLQNDPTTITIDHAAATMIIGGRMDISMGDRAMGFPQLGDEHLWVVVIRAGAPLNVEVLNFDVGHVIALNYLEGAAHIHTGHLEQIVRNGYQTPNCGNGCSSVTLVTVDDLTNNIEAYRRTPLGWEQVWANYARP